MSPANHKRLAEKLGVKWLPWQRETYRFWEGLQGPSQRLCLYFRTGAGKSLTALSCLALSGHQEALVIAPPSTYASWLEFAERVGIEIQLMSHAKFRMKSTQVSRFKPVIADEFHLFGGHQGVGWRKLDTLALHLQAPMILLSATPNYNDAERVYCIQHILDPHSCKGGYLAFLYAHCTTRQNPYAQTPDVTGFHHHASAAEYLAALPNVRYVPDKRKADIVDSVLQSSVPDVFEDYGLNVREKRIVASLMEKRHQASYLNLIDDDGWLRPHVQAELETLMLTAHDGVMIFCQSSKVALAASRSLKRAGYQRLTVTGNTSSKHKDEIIQLFRDGKLHILIGTATLATGTDGLDQHCNTLIILNDTDDNALRRQLIGRILPRGRRRSSARKDFYRITFR